MIKHFAANTEGRDFVCGDIHGTYSRLQQFLDYIGFDKSKDRLFGVGDLVDRGDENEKCLFLLYEPWFHCVKGNHEEMAYLAMSGDSFWQSIMLKNGGHWIRNHLVDMSDESVLVRGTIREMIPKLPLMMTVDKADGTKFHVIHAELWTPQNVTDEDLLKPEYFASVASKLSHDGECILWGRKLFSRMFDIDLNGREIKKIEKWALMYSAETGMFNPKLSHIYSGHTVVRRPIQLYGQTNLDTGSFRSYPQTTVYKYKEELDEWAGLTVTEPATGKFWLVNSKGVNEVSPIIIKEN